MIQAPIPFSPEQVLHFLKTFFTKESLIITSCSFLALIANHILFAPLLWKALGSAAFFFVWIDLITGIIKSKRSPEEGRAFNSRDLSSTIIKVTVYLLMFLFATATDILVATVIPSMGIFYILSTSVLGIITIREAKSIIENCQEIFARIKEPWPFDNIDRKILYVLSVLSDQSRSKNSKIDCAKAILNNATKDEPKECIEEEKKE